MLTIAVDLALATRRAAYSHTVRVRAAGPPLQGQGTLASYLGTVAVARAGAAMLCQVLAIASTRGRGRRQP